MIKTLAHVCIKTSNLEKTTEFYCDALGLEKLFNFTRHGEVIGYYIRVSPDTFIEVFDEKQPAPYARNQTLHHFCLESADLEGVRNKLLDQGYAPRDIKMGADHSLQFWVTDPNGLELEFHQYSDQSAQFTGRDVEVDW